MAKDKSTAASIAQVLQSDLTINSESLQLIQEDLVTAEKERLHAGQRRKQLLTSLRESVKKVTSSGDTRDKSKEEYIRLIRLGIASDIELASLRLKKELLFLRNKNYLSGQMETLAAKFHKLVEIYREKKKLYERLEKKIQDVKILSLSNENSGKEKNLILYKKLVQIAISLRADLIRIVQSLLSIYGDLEDRIGKSIGEESRYRYYFFACARMLPENKYNHLMSLAADKSKLPIDLRIVFFRQMVECLCKIDATVSAKAHRVVHERAREFLLDGRLFEAEEELRFALHAAGGQAGSYRLLAQVFFLEKKEDCAYAALEEVLRQNPFDTPLRKRVALYWKKKSDWEQTILHYEILLQQNPEEDSVQRELGLLLYRQKEYSRAFTQLRQYLAKFDEDTECRRIYGICLTKLARYADSLALLVPCNQENPEDVEVGMALALAYRELQLYPDAEAVLVKMMERCPDALDVRLFLGNLYHIAGRLEVAVQAYSEVQARQPDSASLRLALGRILAESGHLEESIVLYETLSGTRSCTSETQLELGECYRKAKRFEDAERIFLQVCQESDNRPSSWQCLSSLYMESGQWDLASAALLRAARRIESTDGNLTNTE